MDEIYLEDSEVKTSSHQYNIPSNYGMIEWVDCVIQSWSREIDESDFRYSRVTEIYQDHIIASRGYGANALYFKIPYAVGGDGKVSFDSDAKQGVEQKREWVEKSVFQSSPLAVKSLGDNKIGGYAIVWGNEAQKDLDGQYFTKDTEDLVTIFKSMGKIPWLVQHAADEVIKSVPVAEVTTLEPDSTGLWFEAKVIAHDLYRNYVSRLIEAGKLYSSVGALPASVKAEKSGYISRFAVAELSGTWSPADPHQVISGHRVEQLKSFYKDIGVNSDLFEQESDAEQDVRQPDAEEAAEMLLSAELIQIEREWLELQNLTL
jgi:phage head maturation protease